MKKLDIGNTKTYSVPFKLNWYEVFYRAVENGVSYGYRRAFKYTKKPDEEIIKGEIIQAVMNELCEIMEAE